MAIYAQGGKIKQPLYTGSYSVTQIGAFMYMYLLTSGTLTIMENSEYDFFAAGGGGGGGYPSSSDDDETYNFAAGGGGSGYTNTALKKPLNAGAALSISIGSGGAMCNLGGNTSIVVSGLNLSAAGGKSVGYRATIFYRGADGGSGGGGTINTKETLSNDGTGNGGSDGGNGELGENKKSAYGGVGQGTTTRAFAEIGNTLYAGGGGGGDIYYRNNRGSSGGSGGGGAGGFGSTAGANNTGGGGGGGQWSSAHTGKAGGSGIAIVRWKA